MVRLFATKPDWTKDGSGLCVGVGDALKKLSLNELWGLLEVLISSDLYHSCRMITEMNCRVRLEPALSFWDLFSGRRCAPKSPFLLCHYVRTEKA